MTRRPASPRLDPIDPASADEATRQLLDAVSIAGRSGTSSSNVFTTLVRHPGLFRKWIPFGGKLLAGKLPARDRELMILRTAWRCQADYEWGQHVLIGRGAGVTDTEIDAVRRGPDDPIWSALDATLLRAVDELHDDACVGDATWAVLAAGYDEQQLIEAVMLVGHYHMVAYALNSLGVQRDEGVPGFEE